MDAKSTPSGSAAGDFIEASSFIWHQRFELVPGLFTPGSHDIHELWSVAGVPTDLTGKSLIDIGTSNGATAFVAERYGAERVVAVDIYEPDWFGFDALHDFLGSNVEFRRAMVYELPRSLEGETFDYVVFWGVLYHLRHPLLALDNVRMLLADGGEVSIETALYDGGRDPVLRFYRRDELSADPSNWFTPTMRALRDWCVSSGLTPVRSEEWGAGDGKRGVLAASKSPGDPEYMSISYETPLHVQAVGGAATLGVKPAENPPGEPWTEEYVALHRGVVSSALDDPALIERIVRGETLPTEFGIGLDERVIEFPWLFAQGLEGRILDAGSSLNHAHVLDRVLPLVSQLHVVTLEPEASAFPELGVSYVYADLRDLPYRNDYFDTVVSVSTLEHVGMDNRGYGVMAPRSEDPVGELRRAFAELRRVASSRLLLTVPYGRREDHGWFRQFDREDVELLVDEAGGRVAIDVFLYGADGWRRSDLEEASDAAYRDFAADPSPVADRAAAARAVACLAVDL
jgi:SAM-dependent methyltransferase